jgi:superfamily II DNA/RNA helicase
VETREVRSKAVANPFYQWAGKYGVYDGWKGFGFYGDAADMLKIREQIFPERGVRVPISSLENFPEILTRCELIELPDNSAKLMTAALKTLKEHCANDNPEDSLIESLREHQRAELLKIPYQVEHTLDAIAEGRSVVLFVNYSHTREELAGRLGLHTPVGQIHGQQTPDERQKTLDQFAEDKIRVIVANIKAASESINLQDCRGEFPRVSFINPPFSANEFRQAGGRTRRATSKSLSVVRYLFASGTREEGVYKNVVPKMNCLDALNDGDLDIGRYDYAND